jgi:hypothetical protein
MNWQDDFYNFTSTSIYCINPCELAATGGPVRCPGVHVCVSQYEFPETSPSSEKLFDILLFQGTRRERILIRNKCQTKSRSGRDGSFLI